MSGISKEIINELMMYRNQRFSGEIFIYFSNEGFKKLKAENDMFVGRGIKSNDDNSFFGHRAFIVEDENHPDFKVVSSL